MKKTIKTICILLSCLVIVLPLASCGKSEESIEEESIEEEKPLSAFELLDSYEESVYFVLSRFSSTLGQPSSLRLIELRYGKTSADDPTKKSVFVKISANNSFGSSVSEVYVISGGHLSQGGAGWYSTAEPWVSYDNKGFNSVGKINAALQEYFTSMGW